MSKQTSQEQIEEILEELNEDTLPEYQIEKAKAKINKLLIEARIDELEKIPKEPNYGDEGKATEYVEERLNQLSQQTPNN